MEEVELRPEMNLSFDNDNNNTYDKNVNEPKMDEYNFNSQHDSMNMTNCANLEHSYNYKGHPRDKIIVTPHSSGVSIGGYYLEIVFESKRLL